MNRIMVYSMDSVADYLRTINLISHSRKVVLKFILNRFGLKAERCTTEQIFNFRILCEKYFQHQQNLTMSSLIKIKPLTEYGMQPYGPRCGGTILVHIRFAPLKQLYNKATSAVQMNGSMGE